MKNWKLWLGGVMLVVLIGGLTWMAGWLVEQSQLKQQASQNSEWGYRQLEGNLACLPKKGPGPHTMECAFGLKTSQGYYQLDSGEYEGSANWSMDYTFKDTIRVSGQVVAPDWRTTYDIEGVMIIEEIELVQAAS